MTIRTRWMPFAVSFSLACLCAPCFVFAGPESHHVVRVASMGEDEDGERLLFPSFVACDAAKNEIYLIDSRGRIIVLTNDFFPFLTIDKRHGIEAPLGLAVDRAGRLFVTQAPSKSDPRARVTVLDPSLQRERDIYPDAVSGAGPFLPQHIALDAAGNLYLTGPSMTSVVVLSREGRFLRRISVREDDEPVTINGVTIDDAGNLYAVSEEEGRVYVYDRDGAFLLRFGDKGGTTGKLSRPQAVAVERRSGRIYVVDYMRHTVSFYDMKGNFLFEFGGMGWGEGWFQFPRHVAVDDAGRIFVADTFNHRVEVYQP